MKEIKKIYFLLSKKYFLKACALFFIFILMALLDVVGIASIFPFIMLLSDPSVVETNVYLNYLFKSLHIFNVTTVESFNYFVGFIFFLLLIISITFKAFNSYLSIRFIHMCEYNLSKRLVKNYLRQPYSWFLNKNSSDLGKTVLSEVGLVVGGYINSIINLSSQILLSILIVSMLIYADPIITISILLVLGTAYTLIFFLSKKSLDKVSRIRFESNSLRFSSISEAFSAVKEVKMSGSELIYSDKFTNPSKLYAKSNAFVGILSQIPGFALEILAFGGVILIILVLMSDAKTLENVFKKLNVFSKYFGYF